MLDCDPKHNHATPQEMERRLKELDFTFGSYSTFSGGRRYVLPITRFIHPAEYAVLQAHISKMLGEDTHDPCIKVPSQPYFTPTRQPDEQPFYSWHLSDDGPYDVNDTLQFLAKTGKSVVSAVQPSTGDTSGGGGLLEEARRRAAARVLAGPEDVPDFEPVENHEWIKKRCGFMAHCETNAATLGEQEWYAWLSVIGRCKNGKVLAHQIGGVYPGYDHGETDSKLQQALSASGPRTCADIETRSPEAKAACATCPLRGKITSPIELGKPDPATAPPEEVREDMMARAKARISRAEGDLQRARKAAADAEASLAKLKDRVRFAAGDKTEHDRRELAEAKYRLEDLKKNAKKAEKDLDAANKMERAIASMAGADPATVQRLKLSGTGRAEASHFNIAVVLANDPKYSGGKIWWDEFRGHVVLEDCPVDDNLETTINIDLQGRYNMLKNRTAEVSEILAHQAKNNRRHPVREYLRSLQWDQTERLPNLMQEGFGCTGDPNYLSEVGVRILLSAVARVLHPRTRTNTDGEEGGPGCKVDTMLVLVGAQGLYKSMCFKALVPKKTWFSDTRIDLLSKDAFAQIQGKWIYEVQEVDSQQKAEHSSLIKAFLSSDTDNFRKVWGRNSADSLRQLILVGTTNHEEFLSDPTGDRRFVPVSVVKSNPQWVRKNRDQLWAEAVVRYDRGDIWWWETHSEAEGRRKEAAAVFYEQDPWTYRVKAYLNNLPRERVEKEKGVVLSELLEWAVLIPTAQLDKNKKSRMCSVLRNLGCVRTRVGTGATREYRWSVPPDLLSSTVTKREESPITTELPEA
jgi:hypothetical protein